jgi:hypothetical protein
MSKELQEGSTVQTDNDFLFGNEVDYPMEHFLRTAGIEERDECQDQEEEDGLTVVSTETLEEIEASYRSA